MKRPCCLMALGMLLGICIAIYGKRYQMIVAEMGLVGFCILFLIYSQKGTKKPCRFLLHICLVGVMFFLGWEHCVSIQESREYYDSLLEDGMQICVQGELCQKEIKNAEYVYQLTACNIVSFQKEISKKMPVFYDRILVYSDTDIASIGEILTVNGTVELWNVAVNEGNFNEKSFYETRGIGFEVKEINLMSITGEKCQFREKLVNLRNQLKAVYINVMGETQGGVMTAMVTGNKSVLDPEIKRLYQLGGLSHILAISGLHISIIGMSLYRLLRKSGCGFGIASGVAGGVMYVYTIFVGASGSVKRAVVMFLLMLGAQVLGRGYDSLNALGIAALCILWGNPMLLFDAGFQFSFTAVLGIVWLGKRTKKEQRETKKQSEKRGWFQRLFSSMYSSICIQLATLPVAAWYYYEVPIYAIIVNLFVLPCMGVVLTLGVGGGFVGLLTMNFAKWILFPCGKMLEICQWICSVVGELPGAMWITGKPAVWKIALYYSFLVVGKILLRKKENEIKQIIFGIALLLGLFWHPAGGFELDVLDVGQGDGSFLRTNSGNTIFVDGGSSDVKKVGEYRILPFLKSKGIKKIDCWFVSHTDTDHISGLKEILSADYRVEYLVLAKNIEQDDTLVELLALAKENQTQILWVEEGDVLHLGQAEIKVLAPLENAIYADKNAASLVLLYEEDNFSGIFTGDIDVEVEEMLVEHLMQQEWSDVDFYKAAHHGSKNSNGTEILELLQPKVTTVSCGKNNRYGHPAAEAVERIENVGSYVFYTMNGGQIKIREEEGELRVVTFLEPDKIYGIIEKETQS